MFSWICAKAGRAAIFGLIAGLGIGGAVGFGLGVYFLPILTAGPGLDQAVCRCLPAVLNGVVDWFVNCPVRTRCTGSMAPLWLMPIKSVLMA